MAALPQGDRENVAERRSEPTLLNQAVTARDRPKPGEVQRSRLVAPIGV